MTFVPVDVFRPPTPTIAESTDHPAASGVLSDSDVSQTPACPWPRKAATTPLSSKVDAATSATHAARLAWDIVDEWGDQSFPASDPPANW